MTKEQIEAHIARVDFHVLPGNEASPGERVTICQVTLVNDFDVRGESACVDPANFDRDLGEHYAREDAMRKLWPLFGFLLAEQLHQQREHAKFVRMDAEMGHTPTPEGPALTIGGAVQAMLDGRRVARAGWNGKGMFLYYVGPGRYPAASPVAKAVWGEDGVVPYLPYIAMRTVTGEVVPWLCSQSDLLATDWSVID